MGNLQELFYMRQLLGSGQGWLQVGFLLCLFGVLLFRRERIVSPALFNCAWLLFALSFMVPHLLTFCFGFLQFLKADYASRSVTGTTSLLMTLRVCSGPILFGLSVVFAFLALSPGTQSQRRESPTKHPLE